MDLTSILVSFFGTLVLGTLFTMLAAKILKQQNVFVPSIKYIAIISVVAAIISLTSGILNFILVIASIVLAIYLIKVFFKTTTGRAAGIYFIALGFTFLLAIILFVLAGLLFKPLQNLF